MSTSFDITQLTNPTTGLFAQINTNLSNLSLVLYYYNQTLTDTGINNYFELGNDLVAYTNQILDIISYMTQRLQNIYYTTDMPSPPCYTGTTGPTGWTACS